jgi:hypothetical protein
MYKSHCANHVIFPTFREKKLTEEEEEERKNKKESNYTLRFVYTTPSLQFQLLSPYSDW